MNQSFLDLDRYRWREVKSDRPRSLKIRHDFTILGYDQNARALDLLVRRKGDGGHCPIHRHVSTTTIFVIAGEQHLWNLKPDGSRGAHRIRKARDYALTVGNATPHLERGGAEGGVMFFGNHSADGRLCESFDESMRHVADVSIESLVADWKANA
jgi:hypothetical protein